MIDKIVSLAALMVFGGMLVSATRPGATTAAVIDQTGRAFAGDLYASEGRNPGIFH